MKWIAPILLFAAPYMLIVALLGFSLHSFVIYITSLLSVACITFIAWIVVKAAERQ